MKYFDINEILKNAANESVKQITLTYRGRGKQYSEREQALKIIIKKEINMTLLIYLIDNYDDSKTPLERYNKLQVFQPKYKLTEKEFNLIKKVVEELSNE